MNMCKMYNKCAVLKAGSCNNTVKRHNLKNKYTQSEIMPHKFATCTVKHFFKKKVIAKKVLNNSKSFKFLK